MIDSSSTLTDIAFAVCTAFEKYGKTIVLTGGRAASIYAPEQYQSRNLDFMMRFSVAGKEALDELQKLGFEPSEGSMYKHSKNPITIDFIVGDILIGERLIQEWATMRRQAQVLFLLKRTDCICDRLASYLYSNDLSALSAAAAVYARTQPDIEPIREWLIREKADVDQTLNRLLSIASRTPQNPKL
ncbi:MAG: hypothetical protein KF824_08635 [Fimbriimonadaceae bacterium]|nr:MAG: hypothetical protein KF824_08635 [Fimbriimonadaceae bacterium]